MTSCKERAVSSYLSNYYRGFERKDLAVRLTGCGEREGYPAPALGPLATFSVAVTPQIDSIEPDDDLVLLTIGGNDIGFIEVAEFCILPSEQIVSGTVGAVGGVPGVAAVGLACEGALENAREIMQRNGGRVDGEATELGAAIASLEADADPRKVDELRRQFDAANYATRLYLALIGIHKRAPSVQIVLVSYPVLLGGKNGAGDAVRALSNMGTQIQREVVDLVNWVAGDTNPPTAILVEGTADVFSGHEYDMSDNWITAFTETPPSELFVAPVHPNLRGHWAIGKLVRDDNRITINSSALSLTDTSDATDLANRADDTRTSTDATEPRSCTCPEGTLYDGANCMIAAVPDDATAFEWGNGFYYTPVSGLCPLPSSEFDGANCLYMEKPPGGFIWQNQFYMTPQCSR